MAPTDGFPDPTSSDGFGAFGVVFGIVFVLFVVIFLLVLVRGFILPGAKYLGSSDEQMPARLVSRRTNVSGGVGDTGASTSYYATFEFPSGERREFRVRGRTYGLMVEGDEGTLTFRGNICQRFERTLHGRATSTGQSLPPASAPVSQPAPVADPTAGERRPGEAWTS